MSDPFGTAQKQKRNGDDKAKRGPSNGARPVPPINIRTLVEERNWPALAGLGLIAFGILYVLQDALAIHFNLWSLLLLGIGGWLMADAWQVYDRAGRVWVENSRHRALAGALVVAVALLGVMAINWWGLLLLGLAGWLGFDAWRRYERNSRVWTYPARNRAFAAGALGLLGLFGLFNLGSAWPLLLIVVGVVMLWGRGRGRGWR